MICESDLNIQLSKIIKHDLFCRSKRSISFLEYICSCKIQGRENYIKEYSIGVDAFGLSYSFNPQDDPRVRVEARRLRKKLEQYYKSAGALDSIIINIPTGSYIPLFESSKQNYNDRSDDLDLDLEKIKSLYFHADEIILKFQNFKAFEHTDYCIYDFILASFSNNLYKKSRKTLEGQSIQANKIFYLNLEFSESPNEIIVEIEIHNNGNKFILKKEILKKNIQDSLQLLEKNVEELTFDLLFYCNSKVRSNSSHE